MRITVDGVAVELQPGQTVAAAAPSTVFCGIGVCFACVVTVNGVRDVRACQRIAADGDEVRTVS
ncbi:MAG: 2Fe-2S iron-sulfur cluster-binding protein [Kibdelosporangium sp.]